MPDFFVNHPSNILPSNFTTNTLKESKAIGYHKSLPVYQPTPLVSLPGLARKYGVGNIYLKNEAFRSVSMRSKGWEPLMQSTDC